MLVGACLRDQRVGGAGRRACCVDCCATLV